MNEKVICKCGTGSVEFEPVSEDKWTAILVESVKYRNTSTGLEVYTCCECLQEITFSDLHMMTN